MTLDLFTSNTQTFIGLSQSNVIYIGLFLIIFILSFYSINKTILKQKDQRTTSGIIAAAIAILAIAYMDTEQIQTILTTYNALGFITTFLAPFVIITIIIFKAFTTSKLRRITTLITGAIFTYFSLDTYSTKNIFLWIPLIITGIIIILDKPIEKLIRK